MDGLTAGVGTRIRLYRKKRGLSLTDLSRLTGVAASNLSSIELDKTSPTLNTLIKIADAFDIKVGALLDEILYGAAVSCPASGARFKAYKAEGVSIAAFTDHVQKAEINIKLVVIRSGNPSYAFDSQSDTFVYCLGGSAKIVVQNADYFMAPGDGIYIRANTHVKCTAHGQGEVRLLTMSTKN